MLKSLKCIISNYFRPSFSSICEAEIIGCLYKAEMISIALLLALLAVCETHTQAFDDLEPQLLKNQCKSRSYSLLEGLFFNFMLSVTIPYEVTFLDGATQIVVLLMSH